MDNRTFSRAVQSAQIYLEAERSVAPIPEPNDHAIAAADNLDFGRYVRAVVERGSKAAWDALSACVADLIESGEPIPPSTRPLLVAVLSARVPGPKSKGGGETTRSRDKVFGEAVDIIGKRYGLLPMRDATRALACCIEGGSGVDAAGVAMFQFNEHKTYMGWTHAYRRYRKFSAIDTPLNNEASHLLRLAYRTPP